MKRRRFWLIAVWMGLGTLALSGLIMVTAAPAGQVDPPNLGAAYIGSNRCDTCHNTAGAELWDAWAGTRHARTVRRATEETILGDLTDEEALTVTWPDGEQRPITVRDITYVIGGNYIQQYVSVMADENGQQRYYLLPVVWNIPQEPGQAGTWTPYHPDDWTDPARDWRLTCAGCHTTGLTRQAFESGTRLATLDTMLIGEVELGVGCEACHGPGGDHNGGLNPLPRTADAQVCAQCHAKGHDTASDHPFPLDFQPGMAFDADVFMMASLEDGEFFWPTGHARSTNSQYNEWLASAHADALSVLGGSDRADDSCLRCHAAPLDSTDPTPETTLTLADAVYGVTCVACHNPHGVQTESEPFGPFDLRGDLTAARLRLAAPDGGGAAWQAEPGVTSPFLLRAEPYALCVGCHTSTAPDGEVLRVGEGLHHPVQEMYEGRQVVEAVSGIPSAHFSAEGGPDCLTCHMPDTAAIGAFGGAASHLLRPILPADLEGEQAAGLEPYSCTACHAELVTAQDVQRFIDQTQASFRARLESAKAAADSGAEEWITLAISLVEGDGSLGVHNYSYADALLDAVDAALGIEAGTGAPAEEPAEAGRSIIDAVADRLDAPALVMVGAGLVGVAIGAVGFAFRKRDRRLRYGGPVVFLLGAGLIAAAFLLPPPIRFSIAATGEDGGCLLCHAQTDRTFTLADGNTLSLGVDLARRAASVHGESYPQGQLGCLDCHGADAFPHEGPPPGGRRRYRIAMSDRCATCHADDLAHYNDYLSRNYPVGCTDCHTAHYVQPASTLPTDRQP